MAFLVSGGGGGGGGVPVTPPLTNTSGVLAPAGTPTYSSADLSFSLAKADTQAHASMIGLTQSDVAIGASGTIQTSGPITLTTAQWDFICGTSGGLAFGAKYYVSAATAGKLTTTPPGTPGQFQTFAVRGVSSTVGIIVSEPPIGL